MRENTRRCTVGRPAEEVWDHLSDYNNVVRMASSDCEVTLISGTPGTEGARYSTVVTWEGLHSEFRTVLKESNRPHSLFWTGSGSGASASLRLDLAETDPGRTQVAATYALSLSKTMLPLEPFGWVLMERMADRLMRKLRALG